MLGDARFAPIDPVLFTGGGRVRLRRSRPEDTSFALGLYLDTSKAVLDVLGIYDGAFAHERFLKLYRPDRSWVAWDGDERVGWLQLDETVRLVTLRQIHLVPAYRNRRIGGAVLRELLGQASARGRRVALNVVRTNRAIAFYERLGFTIVGRRGYRLRMLWEPSRPAPPGDPGP